MVGKVARVNFARVPDYWCHVMASLGAMGMSHCVDDMLVAERAATIRSGYSLWRGAVALAGWDVPDKKSPPPTSSSQILGVLSDLSQTTHNPPQIRVTETRVKRLQAQLNEVLQKEKLGSGLAGKLWERLQFASTQAHGRTGRAMLRALNRRQHEGGRHGPQPTAEVMHHMVTGPPSINMVERLVMISYSDGEGSYAQVGIALWALGQKMARAGIVRIPDDLRAQWDSKRKGNRYNDKNEV